MIVSLNWIKELLGDQASSLPEVEVIADTLTRIGHEVEEIRTTSTLPDSVIIGEVLETQKHPDADRLNVCSVRISETEITSIICGAPNVAAGQLVPVATPGSVLPIYDKEGKPLKIKVSKIRGIESNGMICAMDELALGEDHDGIMVLNNEVTASDIGRPFAEVCGLLGDTLIEVSLTPNRPDAASHRGLARDLCAALGLSTVWSFSSHGGDDAQVDAQDQWSLRSVQSSNKEHVSIELKDSACPRYVARWVHNVTIAPSPLFVRQRLESLGLRSVNNVVDATNWVLHEMGHPTHAFDAAAFTSGSLRVQRFDHDTSFTTLDHVERTCPVGTLFICDGDKPVAIAGVMGGLESEVSDQTTDILLESAMFAPSSIRKTSKVLGLQSDASYRFERGADPLACMEAADRVIELIEAWAGGEVSTEVADVSEIQEYEPQAIEFDTALTTRILGHTIEDNVQFNTLTSLGCVVEESESVYPPSFRPDLTRPIDLVEEVGRLWDYNRLPEPSVQQVFVPQPIPQRESFIVACASACMRLGYREIQANSLIPKEDAQRAIDPALVIHTLNPVSSEATSLRPTLAIGGLNVFQRNRNRGVHAARCFEIGHVYRRTEGHSEGQGTWHQGIEERTHLWIGVTGPATVADWAQSSSTYRFDHLKRDLLSVLHVALGSSVQVHELTFVVDPSNPLVSTIHAQGDVIGTFTELGRKERSFYDLDSPTFMVEIDLDTCFEFWNNAAPTRAAEVSKFPSIDYDFALVVASDVTAGTLEEIIRETGSDRLHHVLCFDVYEGDQIAKNTKSLAFRCTFLDPTKTLTFNEVEDEIKLILNSLKDKTSAELRT
ncbi:MAG: phenylalanine--tRNA ligase subunit beta [Bacteroidetes bacterium]|nr:phenylalanine--tRNA ligase subunit beta [Bacteroidota bacterium]